MAIEFYKEFGTLGYLANYSNHGFYEDGIFYKTVEHYYQAHKFTNKNIVNKILDAKTPKEASIIGRDPANIRRKDIDEVKLDIMKKGLYLKFTQNKDIRSKLIETGHEDIKEMSVKESYWGVGPNLDGENHIGKLLIEIRDIIRKELKDEIVSKCQNKEIYVIGHHKPDADSLISAYLLTNILKSKGINAVFAARDNEYIDDELTKDNLLNPKIVNDYKDKYFILVDHNSLDGIPKDQVLGAIDHHRITGEVEDLIETEGASTALLIYDLFKDEYDFSSKDKYLIALSVLTDTDFLTSSRFKEYDKKLFNRLGTFDITDLRKKYFKLNNFDSSIEENLYKDYKEYDYHDNRINRSLIKSTHEDRIEHFDEYKEALPSSSINLLIWCDYDDLATYICFNGYTIKFPVFTTSTNFVLDHLEKQKYLVK